VDFVKAPKECSGMKLHYIRLHVQELSALPDELGRLTVVAESILDFVVQLFAHCYLKESLSPS
jgi:hypothetical protein